MASRSFLRWRGWEIPSFLSISESLRASSAEPEGALSLTASRYCVIPVRREWVYNVAVMLYKYVHVALQLIANADFETGGAQNT